MTETIRYECGCTNATHEPTGALRSVSKCPHHRAMQRDPKTLGRAYYEEIGAIVDGVPQSAVLAGQLFEALGYFPWAQGQDEFALDFGCGCSMFAASLLRAGYSYAGIDQSKWGCDWTASTYDVLTSCQPIQRMWTEYGRATSRQQWDLILATHVIEHLPDAPDALVKLAGLLRPGGELWIVVPDDQDHVNPDHLWAFTESSLRKAVELAGLMVQRQATRRYIEREQFLYLRAVKP